MTRIDRPILDAAKIKRAIQRLDSAKVKWRVQVRKSRAHKWVNKGLFETREVARFAAGAERRGGERIQIAGETCRYYLADHCGYGFGNVRVVRHISGKGK